MEQWKHIVGYEGRYMVSNLGNVKSIQFKGVEREYILKKGRFESGYLRVCLYKDGHRKLCRIHRLVYEAFIGIVPCDMTINHKDENKENNCLENLELLTVKENVNYGTRNKRMAESLSKKVYQYTIDRRIVKIWNSTQDCARAHLHQGAIIKCCHNKYMKRKNVYKNFIWSYAPLND